MSQISDDRTTEEAMSAYEDTIESTTIKTETDQLSVHDVEQEQEQEEGNEDNFTWVKTPLVNQRFILKHPRVILSFLRFIDEYNELADPDEVLLLPAIPQRIVQGILQHGSVLHPPIEFLDQVNELRQRLEAHMDLSELPQEQ
jgi:hypothetical protein